MRTGYRFERRECAKCHQLISVVQFSKHEGSKACADIARANLKAQQCWARK